MAFTINITTPYNLKLYSTQEEIYQASKDVEILSERSIAFVLLKLPFPQEIIIKKLIVINEKGESV